MNWYTIISVGLLLPIGVSDYVLVANGYRSYSLATWLAESAHPTLILGVALAFIIGIYECYRGGSFPGVVICGFAGGHLATSEGAAIATMRAARWQPEHISTLHVVATVAVWYVVIVWGCWQLIELADSYYAKEEIK